MHNDGDGRRLAEVELKHLDAGPRRDTFKMRECERMQVQLRPDLEVTIKS